MLTITLKPNKEASLLRFHPWIFSGAIHKINGAPEEGDLVEVVSHQGDSLAVGHYQIGSIAVRVLSFEKCEVDSLFWKKRISNAYRIREKIGLVNSSVNNTYRLVHGEGDLLPMFIN